MEKNNDIHKILKIITTVDKETKNHDHRNWTYSEIAEKTHWIKWFKFSTTKTAGLCDILINEAVVGRYEVKDNKLGISIEHHTYLDKAKKAVATGQYKEPIKWWVWPLRILAAGASAVTIIVALDSMEAKTLKNKLNVKEQELIQLHQRHKQDSILIQELKGQLPKADSLP
jgi:hypothetical protein